MHLVARGRHCFAAVFQQGRSSLHGPRPARLRANAPASPHARCARPAPSPAWAPRRHASASSGSGSAHSAMLPPAAGHNGHVQVVTSDFLSAEELPPGCHLHLIVLNYILPPQTAFLWSRATTRICADGGANRLYDQIAAMLPPGTDPDAARAGHLPDLIKGDLDSVRPDVQEFYTSRGIPMVDLSSDQETTDLEKCLLFLEGRLRAMSERSATAAQEQQQQREREQRKHEREREHERELAHAGAAGGGTATAALGHGAKAIGAANAARAANGAGGGAYSSGGGGPNGSSSGASAGTAAYGGGGGGAAAASSSVEGGGGGSAQQQQDSSTNSGPLPDSHHHHHHRHSHSHHGAHHSGNGAEHAASHQQQQQQQQPIRGEILFLQEDEQPPSSSAAAAGLHPGSPAAAGDTRPAAAGASPSGWLSRLTRTAADALLPGAGGSAAASAGPSSSSSTGGGGAAVHDVHASVLAGGDGAGEPAHKRLHQDHIILVLGALGGRLDHTLSNLNTLYCYRHLNMALWGDGNLVRLLRAGRARIHPSRLEGPTCGLVPLARPATASSSGLKWDLDQTHMCFRGLLSTSNIISSDTVEVATDEDLLWITAVGDTILAPPSGAGGGGPRPL